MRDVETLIAWSRVLLWITAVCVTLFPVLYASFSPWYQSKLGIAVMLQSLSIALTIDYSAANRFIFPGAPIHIRIWIYLVLLSLVALTSLLLTAVLLYLNFTPHREKADVR
jgi:hypothetical protein